MNSVISTILSIPYKSSCEMVFSASDSWKMMHPKSWLIYISKKKRKGLKNKKMC